MTSRKINSLSLSNAQKTKLRDYFSEQTGRKYRSITDITKELNDINKNSELTYELLRVRYNDAVDVQRRAVKAVQAKERRAVKKNMMKTPVKKTPVLMDHVYTRKPNIITEDGNDIIAVLDRDLDDDLKALSKKLVGVTTFYVQLSKVVYLSQTGHILQNKYTDPDSIYWEVLRRFFYPQYDSGPDESIVIKPLQVGESNRVVVLLSDTIIPEKMQQKYRDGGEKHCVIEPIYNLFMSYADNSVSKESKKKLIRTANQIKSFETEYPDGVPEEDMHIIGKAARLCIIIHDIIGNEISRYNSSSSKFIRFTNTRINHIEQGQLCLDAKPDEVTQERLNEIIYEHDRDNVFYLLRSSLNIFREIKSVRGCWTVEDPENKIINNFSKEIGIKKCSYDALKYPEMNELIFESRIINAAPTPLCENPNEIENANHIDLSKAYTLHKECEFYKGFCGVLQQWRKLNVMHNVADFLESHLGIFQFKVTSRDNEFLIMLGIFNGGLYSLPSVEIFYFIKTFKMTCVLTAGAWGSRFDFEYTDEMLDNRRYCIWAGKNGMQFDSNTYTFKGEKKWASHLASVIGAENISFYNDAGTITCKVANKVSYTRHHILAFITAYTRINMMEIMRNIPQQSLIKVILDGIYFRGDIPDIVLPYKNNKELKKHIAFKDYWYNESKVDVSKWAEYKKEFDGNCVLAGAGGTGKTHTILNDKGFVNPKYVVPMHSLGQEIRNKYGVSYDTMHKFIGKGCISRRAESDIVPSVVLIDELTMHDGSDIEKAIAMYPESLIFVAGDIDKKQWYQCRNGDNGEFNELWQPADWRYVFFEKDYRSLDNELRQFKLDVREKMREVFTDGKNRDANKIKDWVLSNYKTISMDEAINDFLSRPAAECLWIAGTHNTNKKLLENGVVSGYIKNKQITFCPDGAEKRGSFTIHSFQGLTISDKRVFISMDNFEYAMFYTAVSRVRNFKQIILVN